MRCIALLPAARFSLKPQPQRIVISNQLLERFFEDRSAEVSFDFEHDGLIVMVNFF